LLDIILPVELSNRNDGQGHSQWRTQKDKKQFGKLLFDYKREPFRIPTFVVVTRLLGDRQRFWDYDSGLRGSWKQLQDALVDAGWWHDDGPEYITGIYFQQDARDRNCGPAVRVQVWQSGDATVRAKQPTAKRRAKGSPRPRKRSGSRSRSTAKRKL
jgi:hypothetical protein